MEKDEIIKAELIQRDNLIKKEANDFVEAGAGAGKTYSLITRIFHQLTRDDNRADPKEIVAITFTNKAAEELRVRIVKRIKEKEKNLEDENKLKDRKAYLLKCIDEMQISTIHKFCDNILRENAIVAGLSPDYQIIVDEDEQKRKNSTIHRFFKGFSSNDWQKYNFLNNNKAVKVNIINCFDSLNSNVSRLAKEDIYFYDKKLGDVDKLMKSFEMARNDYFETIYSLYSEHGLEMEPIGLIKKSFIDIFANFDKYSKELLFIALEKASSNYEIPFSGSKKKALNDIAGYEVYKELQELSEKVLSKKQLLDIHFISLYLEDGYRLYVEYIKDSDNDINHLSNNDLIYRTYKLLNDNPNVASKIRQKIKHLYIDEYQDTDSIQYEIAKLIAGNRDDCLYLVGDPKQSIYRFRGAEPDVFFNTKQTYIDAHSGHDIYNLNINFRSNNYILDWVNQKYSKDGNNISLVSDSSYVYQEMLTADKNFIKEESFSEEDLVGFYFYQNSYPEGIARLIKELVETKKVRHVDKREDKNGNLVEYSHYEKVEYKDIMLLFEGHKKMPPFVDALTRANIPTKISGRSDFSETFALRTFISLFEVLNSNSKSILSIAESVFLTTYPSKYINKNDDECHELTKSLINSLKSETKNMSSYGKAMYLIEHINLLLPEENDLYSFELNNISSKLYQMVEEVFSKGFVNGSELIEQFRNYIIVPIERESSIEKGVNAVQVINLHKAKGLEAPIVIWVSTAKQNNNKKSSTYYKGKYYYGPLIEAVLKVDNAIGVLNEIDAEVEFEKARLEYVAATRPGEAYIFCKSPEFGAGLFNNKSRPYHQEELQNINIDEIEEESELKEETKVDYVELKHNYVNKTTTGIVVKSPSSLENGFSETRFKLKQEAGEIESSNRPSSNLVGTILHRSLELLIKNNTDIVEVANTAISENPSFEYDVEELRAFIVTCLISFNAFFKEKGFDKYKVYPELTFSYYDEKNKVINNGSIDLLLENNGHFIIFDYKSDEAEYISDDSTFEITLKEKYQRQLNMYEKVVKELFNPDGIVKKKIIYFRRYQKETGQIETLCCDL